MKYFSEKSNSIIITILLAALIVVFRFITLPDNMFTWDVFGYYLYLPAEYIFHDISFSSLEWVKQLNEQYDCSGTLYQLVQSTDGSIAIKYTMGLSVVYAPFFFVGYIIANITGFPLDGLSAPFQYSITIGGLIWIIAGLFIFRKVLLNFFSDKITSIILLIIVVGTNFFHLAAIDGTLLSHNILFTLFAILLWSTIIWHRKQKLKYAIIIGLTTGLITLIRPSAMVCVLIPILWNVYDKNSLKEKLIIIKKNFSHLVILILFGLLVISPQLVYWKLITGQLFFNSYPNPGEGLELFAPYTAKFLFSFRKGWFIYTPVMIFSIIGFYNLYKHNKKIFYPFFLFFIFSLWIISSWSCWWYAGGSFSARSMIPVYSVLAFPLGYFIKDILEKKRIIKTIFLSIIFLLIILNLFQSWQFKKGIIKKERMTKEYYFAVFGKTTVDKNDEKLLLVERSVESSEQLKNEEDFNKSILGFWDFEEKQYYDTITFSGNGSLKMNNRRDFSPAINIKFKELTKDYFAWIRAKVNIYLPESYSEAFPVLIITFQHQGKNYKYIAKTFEKDITKGQWNSLSLDYLTPEVRSKEDNLMVYIWHRG
ncbi:MAG: glycosyltransferase family 39 protein, partial [Bacteroidales bacterium]|nr:glycosyltransferase family 39 protein [Bacteroidales bacterium]